MKIYVIRHGQTDVNVENRINSLNDDDLNEIGIIQAKQVGKKMEKIEYDFIISSPLTRTKHTANLLNIKNKNIILIFPKRNLRAIRTSRGKANYCSCGNPFEDKINIIFLHFLACTNHLYLSFLLIQHYMLVLLHLA